MHETRLVLARQTRREFATDRRASLVVVARSTTRALDRLFGVGALSVKIARPTGISTSLAKRTLAGAQRASEHADHADVALQLIDLFGLRRAHLNVGDKSRDRRQGDARLSERRQHVFDVVEEQRVRSDDEHALAFERGADA